MAKKVKTKKAVKKKIVKKKAATKKKPAKKIIKKSLKKAVQIKQTKPIGAVTHFYTEISVAIIKFKENVPVGATLHFRGTTTDFKQQIKSMQHDHAPVKIAPKGKLIGIKVTKRVREGDKVHRI